MPTNPARARSPCLLGRDQEAG